MCFRLLAEREEYEVALPCHATCTKRGMVMTRLHFGSRSVFLCCHEDGGGTLGAGWLNASQECFIEVSWCTWRSS
jgi:hypothetical protein